MPLTYKNARTGKVATVLDPSEVEAEADAEAQRLYSGGTKKAHRAAERVGETGRKAAIHAKHTIERMDASNKWQRVDAAKSATSANTPRKRAAKASEPEMAGKSEGSGDG